MYVFIRMSWNAIFLHCLYRKYNLGVVCLMSLAFFVMSTGT